MQPQPAASPSPFLIFDTLNAFQRSAALKGAIELNLFTAIAEGNTTADQIAVHCQATVRGTRILCDSLVTYGLLTKSDGRYALTPDTATFLDRRSPAYMGGVADFLCHPELAKGWSNIAANVRKGGSTLPGDGTLNIENELWVRFAQGMAAMMMPAAQRIAGLLGTDAPLRVLDIAAGHGMYGISIAKSNPKADITALDWANVLAVAKDNASKMGIADRYHTIEGSFFDCALGSGYDVVLLTNFLHHFDQPTCVGIIRKARAALKDGGKIVTVEFVPNEDRVTPPVPAVFSLTMLAGTPSGDAYTFAELSNMFREAGLAKTERHEVMPGHPQTILISE
ncbi:MAG: class I SAM-dependent methyltransferase [Acidobacteriaceae bacterium]